MHFNFHICTFVCEHWYLCRVMHCISYWKLDKYSCITLRCTDKCMIIQIMWQLSWWTWWHVQNLSVFSIASVKAVVWFLFSNNKKMFCVSYLSFYIVSHSFRFLRFYCYKVLELIRHTYMFILNCLTACSI